MLKTPFWRQPSKSTRTSRTGAWTSTPQNPAFSKSLRAPQFRSTALHPPRAGVAESGWLSAPRRRAARREAPPHKSSSRRQLAGTLPQRPQSPACSQGEGSRWCGAQSSLIPKARERGPLDGQFRPHRLCETNVPPPRSIIALPGACRRRTHPWPHTAALARCTASANLLHPLPYHLLCLHAKRVCASRSFSRWPGCCAVPRKRYRWASHRALQPNVIF